MKLGLDHPGIKYGKTGVLLVNLGTPDSTKWLDIRKYLKEVELIDYLAKIETKTLLAYGVYQIEADGFELFEYIKGDQDSIMGLPIKDIINYINQYKK